MSVASLVLSGCNNSSMNSTGTTLPPTGADPTVAYVYVTNQTTSGGPNQIVAYAADASGALTPVPGSPFNLNVGSMAASGSYLTAVSASDPNINSYTIGSNGALALATQFNFQQQTGYQSSINSTCGGMGNLLFDRTGQSLYAGVDNIDCSSNRAILSFSFDSSKGSLSFLGNVNIGSQSSAAISVLGNNAYAYSALYDACMYGGISSFVRDTNGLLDGVSNVITPQFGPTAPPGSSSSGVRLPSYAPGFTAADATPHVAIAEFPCFAQSGVAATQIQLATYTADAKGDLTTTDTYATMPATAVDPQVLEMSPSGSLLAVGGVGGLQIFHFNGANPITSFTNVLTTDNISQMFWDNNNHLYAITLTAGSLTVNPGKLHVFTVTDTAASEAPGSPYTIATPLSLAVKSK
jgi:hypothetical protein